MVTPGRSAVAGDVDHGHQANGAFVEPQRDLAADDQVRPGIPDGDAVEMGPAATETTWAAGALAPAGALSGGIIGSIVALAAVWIPAIDPVVAGSAPATILMGAAVGGAAGGFFGALVDLDMLIAGIRSQERRPRAGQVGTGAPTEPGL